jgi:hypothetical protein
MYSGNPEAFPEPCGGHNLNLLLGDVAKSLVTAVNFFETSQESVPHFHCRYIISMFKS